MEFKLLYTYVLSLLKSIDSEKIRWIDLEKGQLELYKQKPSVAFPCALVSVSIPKSQNLNHTRQQCNGQVIIRLAFDYSGSTNSEISDDLLNESLSYFDTADLVYRALQGQSNGTMAPLQRTSQTPEAPRVDGINVLRMVFSTSFEDRSARDT